jgi:hypothetical protein
VVLRHIGSDSVRKITHTDRRAALRLLGVTEQLYLTAVDDAALRNGISYLTAGTREGIKSRKEQRSTFGSGGYSVRPRWASATKYLSVYRFTAMPDHQLISSVQFRRSDISRQFQEPVGRTLMSNAWCNWQKDAGGAGIGDDDIFRLLMR